MIIAGQSLRDMLEHFRTCSPEEGCGVLLGTDALGTEFVPITNDDHSPTHFTLNAKEQLQVQKKARRSGQKIVAVCHSHPKGPSRLTKEDIRLAIDPAVLWVLVSYLDSDTDTLMYRIEDGEASAVEFSIQD